MLLNDPTVRQCVWCHAINNTPLLLCPLCEARAMVLKTQRGEVVKGPNV